MTGTDFSFLAARSNTQLVSAPDLPPNEGFTDAKAQPLLNIKVIINIINKINT